MSDKEPKKFKDLFKATIEDVRLCYVDALNNGDKNLSYTYWFCLEKLRKLDAVLERRGRY